MTDKYEVVPFPRSRRLITDVGWMGHRKHTIRGLLEIDVTRPRQAMAEHRRRTGERLSFTAFLATCLGRAVARNKYLHAYRDWRGRLVLFDEVDISTLIETEQEGKKYPVGHIIRAANKKSFRAIHDEIRAVQTRPLAGKEVRRLSAVNALPTFLRRLLLTLLERSPHRLKQIKGTVVLSAVGMFGEGGGWGISLPSHTLGVTVGGISRKPRLVDGTLQEREFLSVTLDFDHDIVDGAPAARFAERLRKLVESGYHLPHLPGSSEASWKVDGYVNE